MLNGTGPLSLGDETTCFYWHFTCFFGNADNELECFDCTGELEGQNQEASLLRVGTIMKISDWGLRNWLIDAVFLLR
jgi:hypothetical protein